MRVNWDVNDWQAFERARKEALNTNPDLLDAGWANVYGWRATRHAREAPDEQAQYRCHVAEAWIETLDTRLEKSQVLVGRGVRHALRLLMTHLGERTLVRPHDVYPEYARIQSASQVPNVLTYAAQQGMPWSTLESKRHWALLICDPLKPWGGQLDDRQLQALLELAQRQDGQVWIDGAYKSKPGDVILGAMASELPVIWMGSLSKGWLLPDVFGGVVGPTPFIDPWRAAFQQEAKDVGRLRQAWYALSDNRQRPHQIEVECSHARNALRLALENRGCAQGLEDPGHGYFMTHTDTVGALAQSGVLAMPAGVFCDPNCQPFHQRSILSAVAFGPVGTID